MSFEKLPPQNTHGYKYKLYACFSPASTCFSQKYIFLRNYEEAPGKTEWPCRERSLFFQELQLLKLVQEGIQVGIHRFFVHVEFLQQHLAQLIPGHLLL